MKPDGVVITGASTGIGAASARHLDRLGFRVFAGIRKSQDGERLRAQTSSKLTPIRFDVTDDGSIAAAADTIRAALDGDGLAGLVNNAGIAVPGPIETVPLAEARKQFEVNVLGQIAVTQAFLPLLRQGRGRIVNIGSIAGLTATPFLGLYGASKFALEALTDALRVEVRPWGINVSIIEPGAIASSIWQGSAARGDAISATLDPAARALYAESMAALREVAKKTEQRAISPEGVAEAVVHALTARRPRTRYLVGTDAKIRAFLKTVLSDRMQDKMVSWFLGLQTRL